ncbi:MAG: biotin--[acetyl-CoA-carboxylase] ligase [Hyphomicrobium sp.]
MGGASSHPAGLPRTVRLDEIDSTNAEAMRRAMAGETGPLWIVADRQTAGRGRSGRPWQSDTGNLLASLLLTLPPATVACAYQLALVAGVAVIDAIRADGGLITGPVPRLKWPNDILIDGHKAGGILVESTSGPGGLKAVIGIGLNLVSHPEGTALPATHLRRHGSPPARDKILAAVAREVAGWLLRWQEGVGFEAIRSAWLERAGPIGEACSVHIGGQRVFGRFAGLDEDGALLVADEAGRLRRYTYGDVTLAP